MTHDNFSPQPQRRPNTEESPKQAPTNPVFEHAHVPQTFSPHTVANEAQRASASNDLQGSHIDMSLPGGTPPNGKPVKKKRKWLPHTKKQWIITIVALVLLIGGGVAAYFVWFKPEPKPAAKKKPVQAKTVEKPKPVYSNLTGAQITDEAINNRAVTGVMIENSPDARPQSGINQAGVVFEAVAEGGITRFLTLYQDTDPGYIGPVRSVRPYYLKWLLGFDAPIAHVGGSAEALRMIKDLSIKDLDQGSNGAYFERISSRYAPHNVYTSMQQLWDLEAKKGFGKSEFTPLARKDDTPSKTPNATSINFALSGALYNPHFDYDAATNSYKRSQAGAPHMTVDKTGTEAQIIPKTVVGLVFPQGREGIYTTYNTIGSGPAYIFEDGVVHQGTWHKSDNNVQFTFTDSAGNPLSLNRGQTWFTALGSADAVTYQ